MIKRNLEIPIKKYSKEYPIIAIVGPRQSGKTTLVQHLFKSYKYISLENLNNRLYAAEDPLGFFNDIGNKVIIDEIQRVPALFSYLQEKVDFNNKPAQYILTGSQQFLLMEKITQSLAGRIITFKLFPFTCNELFYKKYDQDISSILTYKPHNKKLNITDIIFSGMYPRIHDKKLTPHKWLENYVITYLERDIRELVNVDNLRVFENFLKIIASHSGQLVNYASISNATGISQPTVKKWISLLETSGILILLSPYFKNYSKRIVKSPKLYFLDTGLLCFLLFIRNKTDLKTHPLFGNIFETFIISEMYKRIVHLGEQPPLYFWRDKRGNEIDLLIDHGLFQTPIEIKSSQTFNKNFYTTLNYWFNLEENKNQKGLVIYNGDEIYGKKSNVTSLPWYVL